MFKTLKLDIKEEEDIINLHNSYSKSINKTFMEILPEEWVARYSHFIFCGDMRVYSFKNQEFESWINIVYDIIESDIISLDRLRTKYLTLDEIKEINDQIENF